MEVNIGKLKGRITKALISLEVVVDVVTVEKPFKQRGKIIEIEPWKFVKLSLHSDEPQLPFTGLSAGIHRIRDLATNATLYENPSVPDFYKDEEAIEKSRSYRDALDDRDLPLTPSPRMLELREQGTFYLPDSMAENQ